jgi:hypothetical protein
MFSASCGLPLASKARDLELDALAAGVELLHRGLQRCARCLRPGIWNGTGQRLELRDADDLPWAQRGGAQHRMPASDRQGVRHARWQGHGNDS